MTSFSAPDHTSDAPSAAETPNARVSAGQSGLDGRLRQLATLVGTSPHNLVARSERDTVYERHVLEGVALAETLEPSGRWMDLGTGGGLPGLVLALVFPEVEWTLVDATAKKADAVRQFAAELSLQNVVVVQGRAETLGHDAAFRGQFDGVVARALAPMVTLVELARGFLRAGGDLVAVKGPGWPEEMTTANAALARLGLSVFSTERLGHTARETWVVRLRAAGAPPAGFPRRDGVPKTDPLR